ncbi:MAG TPA: thiolase family protein [Bordetella sp.]|nr:thiolase family protein [Bordetella sp.]
MSWIVGAASTPYGALHHSDTLGLMSQASGAALADAQLERGDIDGLLCGYSTTLPHLMLATVFAEHFGLAPSYAHALQAGGATGLAMLMLAHQLVDSGQARYVLVVAAENRLTGQSRDSAVQTLSQVGHPAYELPFGPTIPAYYGLVASRYMHSYGATEEDYAELAVLMRRHAVRHAGAQFRTPISVADVMASRPISTPLKLLDCCPVSDGGSAFIVGKNPTNAHRVKIRGCGQAHTHQHVSVAADLTRFGAAQALARAEADSGMSARDATYAGIYDSFTITLAILIEELGLAPRGEAGAMARAGHFDLGGPLPLNTHGGLLSYGHCGAGGALAHLVEAHLQMTERAGGRQVPDASIALLHGDGGVLSSHVSAFLERA